MKRERLLPEQIPGHADTQEGLVENLIRVGRIRDALALAQEMLKTPLLSRQKQS